MITHLDFLDVESDVFHRFARVLIERSVVSAVSYDSNVKIREDFLRLLDYLFAKYKLILLPVHDKHRESILSEC